MKKSKKIFYIVLNIILWSIALLANSKVQNKIFSLRDEKIINKYLADKSKMISLDDAIKDCKTLKSIMNHYAGKKYYEELGYDFDKVNKSLINDCKEHQANNMMTKTLFTNLIIKNYGFIQDGHLDILYENSECNTISKTFDGNLIVYDEKFDNEFIFENNENYVYMKIPAFDDDGESINNEDNYEQYENTIRNSKILILDLRSNGGGYVKTIEVLCNSIFDDKEVSKILVDEYIHDRKTFKFSLWRDHLSPLVNNYNSKKLNSKIQKEFPDLNSKKADYKGQVYILTNKKTASTSELWINLLLNHLTTKPIIIGQNTKGAMISGNTVTYMLKKSHILLDVPTIYGYSLIKINENYKGENKGFAPDIKTPKGKEAVTLRELLPGVEVY